MMVLYPTSIRLDMWVDALHFARHFVKMIFSILVLLWISTNRYLHFCIKVKLFTKFSMVWHKLVSVGYPVGMKAIIVVMLFRTNLIIAAIRRGARYLLYLVSNKAAAFFLLVLIRSNISHWNRNRRMCNDCNVYIAYIYLLARLSGGWVKYFSTSVVVFTSILK